MTERLTDEQVAWWAQRESISGTSISSVLAREVQEWRAMRDKAEGFRRFLGRTVRATIDGKAVEHTVVVGTLLTVSEWGEFVVEDEGGGKHFCWPALDMEAVEQEAKP